MPGTITRVPKATHSYLCDRGHYADAPHELKQCPVYRFGKPCDGALRRVGKGSRSGS